MYKARDNFLEEERRKQREELVILNRRKFAALQEAVEERQLMTEEDIETSNLIGKLERMDVEPTQRKPKSKTTNGHSEFRISEYLQKSSFLMKKTIIDDLDSEWLIVPKPTGLRVLVVAAGGRTQIVFKDTSCKILQTGLKGGNRNSNPSSICLFDGILSPSTNILYIMDAIILEENPIYEECAELRYFFLQSKITQDLQSLSEFNRIKIELVPRFSASRSNISSIQLSIPGVELDGVLLVDKNSSYILGEVNEDSYWIKKKPVPGETVVCKLTLRYNQAECRMESKDKDFFINLPSSQVSRKENNLFGMVTEFFTNKKGNQLTLRDRMMYKLHMFLEVDGGKTFDLEEFSQYEPMNSSTAMKILSDVNDSFYDSDLKELNSSSIVCE